MVLNDLGPAASFIAAGYNLPFDVERFEQEAQRILNEVEQEIGWMYETLHTDGKTKGRINYTVWSEVFSCPECGSEVNFVAEALDAETSKTRSDFPCPKCKADLNKDRLERMFETRLDQATGQTWKRIALRPMIVNYSVGGVVHEKPIGPADLQVLQRIEATPFAGEVPLVAFPFDDMWEASRLREKGFAYAHQLFLDRPARSLALLWRKANSIPDTNSRRMVLWFAEQAIWGMSVLARYAPTHYSQVNQYLSGAMYVGSQIVDVSPWYILHDSQRRASKLSRLAKCFTPMSAARGVAVVQTGDCACVPVPDKSIDYVFTDPPFGDNFAYWELNFLVESWHGVLSDGRAEAAVDRSKSNRAAQKSLHDYQRIMTQCFAEYYRVLKPGRWITIVFSNSKNAVWRALQEAMGSAGFVVADVRTLDKQQLSFKQVTSGAVKQDLVISAYKPTESLAQRFELGHSTPDAAWAFVKEHMQHVPVFVSNDGSLDPVGERTPQVLLDRMTAFHVQRGLSVPLSAAEFLAGLQQRFPPRDGMHFLPDQVGEYDKKRMSARALRLTELFVVDEVSAIQWVRQQLQDKPQSFQDLQPQFMQQAQSWAKHEQTIELKLMLEQNFLRYDGKGPLPPQIHSYLSTNFKDLRNLDKEDRRLKEKAADRWYVPDHTKDSDLVRLRERALLVEFEEYRASTERKLKLFRTEAVRAGFKDCWQRNDYATIVKVGEKLPENVLQEDEKLLMYYDNSLTRSSTD